MIMKRFAFLSVLALAVTLGAENVARADYSYSTSISVTSAPGATSITNTATGSTVVFGGTTVTLTDVSRLTPPLYTVPGPNTINIGDVAVTTTTPLTSSDTFNINYLDFFTLNNVPPPGTAQSGSFPLTGTLSLTGVNTGNGIVSNAYTGATSASGNLGGVTFTGSTSNFAPPTVNGAGGSLGGLISATAVPEPVSVLMLGLGLGGVGLMRFRKRNDRV